MDHAASVTLAGRQRLPLGAFARRISSRRARLSYTRAPTQRTTFGAFILVRLVPQFRGAPVNGMSSDRP